MPDKADGPDQADKAYKADNADKADKARHGEATPEQARRTPIGSRPDSPDTGESADFAEEHTDMTVGKEISEHTDSDDIETESPRGIGGMDIPPSPLRET
jgi:hypothetical protein